MALNRNGLTVQRLFHPMMPVRRDADGVLEALLEAPAQGAAQGARPGAAREPESGALRESVMHFEFDRQTDPAVLEALEADVRRRAARRARRGRGLEADALPPARDRRGRRHRQRTDHARRARRGARVPSLDGDDHFAFIGYRCYDIERGESDLTLCAIAASGLGILRDTGGAPSRRRFSTLPEEQRAFALGPMALIVNKASAVSPSIGRRGWTTSGIKRFDAKGVVIGEHRFLGLHSSAAYSALPKDIPLLRTKVRAIIERAGLPANSHGGKALQHILDSYPRDELFQASEDELFEICTGIMHLEERRRLRLFTRNDTFGRFVTCLIFIPRERYTTDMRLRMQEILFKALNGTSAEFLTRFSDSVLARVRMTVYIGPGGVPEYSVPEIEARLRETLLSWGEKLAQGAARAVRRGAGQCAGSRATRMPLGPPTRPTSRAQGGGRRHSAARGGARRSGGLQLHLYRHVEDPKVAAALKVYGPDQTMPLADMLPLLENMGLKVLIGASLRDPHARRAPALDARVRPERGARRVRSTRARSGTSSRTRCGGSGAGEPRTTASIAWCSARGWPGATSWCCARTASTCCRRACRSARPTSSRCWSITRGSRELRRAVPRALRPDRSRRRRRGRDPARGRDRGGAGAGHESRRRPHPAALSGDRSRDAAHQLLPGRRAGRAQGISVLQVRSAPDSGAAAAAADVRDLRLLAAGRSGAPARRTGRPGRTALVRSQGGLPHRGARPDEGPDGEELGDRAGGLEGRLRGEAHARGPRGGAGRGACTATRA